MLKGIMPVEKEKVLRPKKKNSFIENYGKKTK